MLVSRTSIAVRGTGVWASVDSSRAAPVCLAPK